MELIASRYDRFHIVVWYLLYVHIHCCRANFMMRSVEEFLTIRSTARSEVLPAPNLSDKHIPQLFLSAGNKITLILVSNSQSQCWSNQSLDKCSFFLNSFSHYMNYTFQFRMEKWSTTKSLFSLNMMCFLFLQPPSCPFISHQLLGCFPGQHCDGPPAHVQVLWGKPVSLFRGICTGKSVRWCIDVVTLRHLSCPGEVGRVSDPPPDQRVRGGQVDQEEQALRHGQVQLLRLQQVQTFCLHLSSNNISRYAGRKGEWNVRLA